jgi:hypothetical protein
MDNKAVLTKNMTIFVFPSHKLWPELHITKQRVKKRQILSLRPELKQPYPLAL